MNAKERNEAVQALGLADIPITGGCGGAIMRNGQSVRTLGALTARDARVEAKGLFRAPHGVEADAILADGRADDIGVEIALDRARSNGRNIFWEGGPGGAASLPEEVRELGAEESRRRAIERAEKWRALPSVALRYGHVPFWAWTEDPETYWGRESVKKNLAFTVWFCYSPSYPAPEGLEEFALSIGCGEYKSLYSSAGR